MTQSTNNSQVSIYQDAQQTLGNAESAELTAPARAHLGHNATPEQKGLPQQGEAYQNGISARNGSEPLGDSKHTFAQAFAVEGQKVHDLWAGLFWSVLMAFNGGFLANFRTQMLLTMCGFVVISGLTIRRYATQMVVYGAGIYDALNTVSLNTNTVVLFSFVLTTAFLVSWGYAISARAFTARFAWATGILNIVMGLGTAVYYLTRRQWAGGILFLLFGIFAVVCFVNWIPRIPFSVLVLQKTMDVARDQGNIFMVSAIGGLAAVAFAAWFSVTLVAIYVAYGPGSTSSPACLGGICSTVIVTGLVAYVTFAGYWITEWLKNTIYTTIAGVYGSWYFFSANAAGTPRGSTRGALRRAVTYSFGSISFGSLGIAVINTLRHIFSVIRYREGGSGVCGLFGSVMFCLAGCVLAALDWLITFFNRYAFSHIALRGKAYVPAAKETWAVMKDRGIDALINDSLTTSVLSMGSVFVAYICSLLSYLFLQFTRPAYNKSGAFTSVIMAYAFIIGLQVCQIFLAPIASGADTIFVAMAWDPQIAVRDHPEFWRKVVSVYPHVETSIQT